MIKITFYLRILVITSVFGFVIAGCKKEHKRAELHGEIKVKLVTPKTRGATRSVTNQNEEISAMYFSTMGIYAYQYSPGYGFEEGFNNRPSNAPVISGYGDWASGEIMGDNYGGGNARQIVLFNGGEVDIAALSRMRGDGSYTDEKHPPTDVYKSKYDNFSVDFLEITTYLPGIFFNNVFYGYFNFHDPINVLRAKYPELGNFTVKWDIRVGTDDHYSPVIEEFPQIEHDFHFSLLLARSDWFPEPVYVKVKPNIGILPTATIEWSNKPLTISQKEMLTSLINYMFLKDNHAAQITNFAIVPYDGPVKLALYDDAEGVENPEITVSFDFTHLLTNETYNAIISGGNFRRPSEIDSSKPAFTFGTSNGRPFGMSASISN